MNIVLEGPDGGGKSWLGRYLSNTLGITLVQGEGPPKSKDEFDKRCRRLVEMDGVVFDRVPFISEHVYGPMIGRGCILNPETEFMFWATQPLIVYVRPTTKELWDGHEKKPHESEEHVAMVKKLHGSICEEYDRRMLDIANVIYRQNDMLAIGAIVAFARQANLGLNSSRVIDTTTRCVGEAQLGDKVPQPAANLPASGGGVGIAYGHFGEHFTVGRGGAGGSD